MPKNTLPKLTLHVAYWTFEEFNRYVQAVQKADFQTAFLILKPIIAAWDYDVDLNQPRPDKKLPVTALPEIIKAVNDATDSVFSSLSLDDLDLDLNRWSMDDFYEYQDAERAMNIQRIEELMKKAATPLYDDYDPEARLGFIDGLLMRKGVKSAQEDLFR